MGGAQLLNKSSQIFAENYFPWSVTRSSGMLKRQNYLSKMASVTVAASLFGRGTNLTDIVRASSMKKYTFSTFACFYRSKQIRVDTLIWFCWLQQRWQQCWGMQIIFLSHLATVAGLDVVGNVSIHTRPVVALKKALFCIIHALLTNFHETRLKCLEQ